MDKENINIHYTDDFENLLKEEAEKAECMSLLHSKAYEKFNSISIRLNIPVIVISSAIGFLSQVQNIVPNQNVYLGAISIFVAILKTIDNFFDYSGTREYISLEILVCNIIINNNNIYITDIYNDDDIKTNKENLKSLKIDIHNYNNTILNIYNEYHKYIDNNNNISNVLINKYYGIPDKYNGYIQKTDIYALGITLYELIIIYNKRYNKVINRQLEHLLHNMVNIDANMRFNVIECLQHPYFSN